ncbi:tetratricopeptide repeat protein [Microbacterium sp.]|uniref:tetratricopeptide repeat protein n=1 Tax=Microbacterium sp. TaxID=51671 RepID=UPI003A914823
MSAGSSSAEGADTPEILEEAARIAYLDGRLDETAKLLEQATRLPDCPPSAWQNLGLVRMDLEDYPGAIEAYSRVVDVIPLGLANRGLAYERVGNSKRARTDYETALSYFPDDVDVLASIFHRAVEVGWSASLSGLWR